MTFIAGILFNTGIPYIEEIRTALLGGAFIFTFAGFIEGAWLAGDDIKGHLSNIVKVAIITTFVATFPSAIQKGDEALASLHDKISQGQASRDALQQDAFVKQCSIEAKEPSLMDISSRLCYTIGKCLQKIGLLGYQIVYWAKDISLLLLISLSPLLLGFLALSFTRSIGVNFLVTTLTIILWNIGFSIVDTLLIILGNIIMPAMGAGVGGASLGIAGATEAIAVTVGPQFVVMSLMAAILPIMMYIAVPIITGIIMRGSNIAGGAMAALSMANQGGAMIHGLSSNISNSAMTSSPIPAISTPIGNDSGSGGSSFGNWNSPDGGSSPSAGGSSEVSSNAISNYSEGSFTSSVQGSTSSGFTSNASSASPSPSGTSVLSPDSSMVATQGPNGMISVTDENGLTSSRPGNISDSVTLAAAFNAHEATPSFN